MLLRIQSPGKNYKKMFLKRQNALPILKKLISINSTVSVSNKEIISYIQNALRKFHPRVDHFKKRKLDLFNLFVKIKGESSESPLLFVMHTDTVNVSEKWTYQPYKMTIQKDRVYGLGASDMKSSLASVMSALYQLKKKPKNDVYIIFDCDEEGELFGGKQAVSQIRKENFKRARIIVPEATGGKIFLGHKACIDLKVTCTGRAKHAGRTCLADNLKDNSIYKAIKIINTLINDEKRLEEEKIDGFGSSIQCIGYIHGGTGVNVVADQCFFKMTRRILPSLKLDQEYKKLIDLIQGCDKEAKINTLFKESGFRTNADYAFVKQMAGIVKNNLGKAEYGYLPGWAESGLFKEFGDCIVVGPGVVGQGHKSDEYASIDLLNKFSKIWLDLMKE